MNVADECEQGRRQIVLPISLTTQTLNFYARCSRGPSRRASASSEDSIFLFNITSTISCENCQRTGLFELRCRQRDRRMLPGDSTGRQRLAAINSSFAVAATAATPIAARKTCTPPAVLRSRAKYEIKVRDSLASFPGLEHVDCRILTSSRSGKNLVLSHCFRRT